MQASLAILFSLSLSLTAADAEPVIERGPRPNVLGGLKSDVKILKLIEAYHKKDHTGRTLHEDVKEELFGLPKEKVLQQLLLILESNDLLIWTHYDFNPSNVSSSKNVYTTVLSLSLESYGTKKDCESIQKFLFKLLSRDIWIKEAKQWFSKLQ